MVLLKALLIGATLCITTSFIGHHLGMSDDALISQAIAYFMGGFCGAILMDTVSNGESND